LENGRATEKRYYNVPTRDHGILSWDGVPAVDRVRIKHHRGILQEFTMKKDRLGLEID
jgi:hypothetical protein